MTVKGRRHSVLTPLRVSKIDLHISASIAAMKTVAPLQVLLGIGPNPEFGGRDREMAHLQSDVELETL